MHTITMITAQGCKHCERMRKTVSKFINKDIKVVNLDSEDQAALDFAIDNSIEDIPACKIGSCVISGEKFSEKDIERAIKELQNG